MNRLCSCCPLIASIPTPHRPRPQAYASPSGRWREATPAHRLERETSGCCQNLSVRSRAGANTSLRWEADEGTADKPGERNNKLAPNNQITETCRRDHTSALRRLSVNGPFVSPCDSCRMGAHPFQRTAVGWATATASLVAPTPSVVASF